MSLADSETGFLRGVLLLTIGQKAKAPSTEKQAGEKGERTRRRSGQREERIRGWGERQGEEGGAEGGGGKGGGRRGRRRTVQQWGRGADGHLKRQLAAQPLEMGHDLKDRYHSTERPPDRLSDQNEQNQGGKAQPYISRRHLKYVLCQLCNYNSSSYPCAPLYARQVERRLSFRSQSSHPLGSL